MTESSARILAHFFDVADAPAPLQPPLTAIRDEAVALLEQPDTAARTKAVQGLRERWHAAAVSGGAA